MLFSPKNLPNPTLQLERGDKYDRSVVAKLESLPDGVYFIQKSGDKFSVSNAVEARSVKQEDISTTKPNKPEVKETKPNKAQPVTAKKTGAKRWQKNKTKTKE